MTEEQIETRAEELAQIAKCLQKLNSALARRLQVELEITELFEKLPMSWADNEEKDTLWNSHNNGAFMLSMWRMHKDEVEELREYRKLQKEKTSEN